MAGIKIRDADGSEQEFDAVSLVNEQLPGASIRGYDASKGIMQVKDTEGNLQEIDIKGMLGDDGVTVLDSKGDFNTPEQALDYSPVKWWMRTRLGLASSEAIETNAAIRTMFKTADQQTIDASSEAGQKRALKILKSEFEDAKIVNNEYVVKQGNTWYKVNGKDWEAGDFSQFAAQTGFNIIGQILGGTGGAVAGGTAGSVAGPVGTGAGAVAGAIKGEMLGSAIGEGAELGLSHLIEGDYSITGAINAAKEKYSKGGGFSEVLKAAIEGGQIDPGALAGDIITEGILGVFGRAAGKAVVHAPKTALAAAEVIGHGNPTGVLEASLKSFTKNRVDGFKNIATNAANGVKDVAAGLFSSLGPNVSKTTMREMLDNPINTQLAIDAGKKAKLPGGLDIVNNEIVEKIQGAVKAVKKENQKQFGELLNAVAAKADDNVGLDLGQLRNNLSNSLEFASKDQKHHFTKILNHLDTLDKQVDSAGNYLMLGTEPSKKLTGKNAVRGISILKQAVANKIEALGGGNPAKIAGANDTEVLKMLNSFENILNDNFKNMADSVNLGKEWNKTKTLYGNTKDALKKVYGKVMNEKTPIGNVQRILREEEGTSDAAGALRELHKLYPSLNIEKRVSLAKALQAGLDTSDWFTPNGSHLRGIISGALATGVTVTGGLAAAPIAMGLAAMAYSPKMAGIMARNLSSLASKGLQKTAVAPEVAAKQLERIVYSSAFLNSLGRVEANKLITNADNFASMLEQAGAFVDDAENGTSDKVMEAAISEANRGTPKR